MSRDPNVIDLRSDTVTQPTPEMRRAIAGAEVGDDVFGDDPTVNALQEKVADLLGKEAALFVPSGSMANQCAIRSHTSSGDEIICHFDSHTYNYESAAPAALSGCSMRFVSGDRGIFDGAAVQQAIRPEDHHFPPSRLVIVENTQNRGGGSVWPIEKVREVSTVAHDNGLRLHLDGARLWNASVAGGVAMRRYAQCADSVSVCFSKGLGAPVGSALAGSREFIDRAHRFRKMFGGGMRQAGMLAAAAIYAMDHNFERLADDHSNAKRLAEAFAELSGVSVDPGAVETNILYADIAPSIGNADEFCRRLREDGVWVLPVGPQRIRAVTHLDVTSRQIDRAIQIARSIFGTGSSVGSRS